MQTVGGKKRLLIAIVEAALELIPPEIRSEPSVVAYAKRRGKEVRYTLLDSSYHHRAMKRLADRAKRGRPDILHLSLLELLESPLNRGGALEFSCHTRGDLIIELNPEVRLPRVYERFKGLMENLLRDGKIVTSEGRVLMTVRRGGVREAISSLSPTEVVLMSERGKLVSIGEVERMIECTERPLFVIGGFPHGDFSDEVISLSDKNVSVSPRALPAWVVASRVLCAGERVLLRG
ncbi:MAG: hypothetical protein NZ920_04360 [Aigarchaeota archaeon]|nr:hypothetical protein [Aigarchaeota archaeon]MDW8092147.1 hypothetical protein [Nitrososphaerota archaeon]